MAGEGPSGRETRFAPAERVRRLERLRLGAPCFLASRGFPPSPYALAAATTALADMRSAPSEPANGANTPRTAS